jgi:serpin B
MKHFAIATFLAFAVLFSGCKKDEPSPAEKQPTQIELTGKSAEVIQRSNQFGVELFKAVSQDDAGETLLISPLSASAALTMLLNGCDGETQQQISEMIGYSDLTIDEINAAYNSLVQQLLEADEEIQLGLANAVWYRNGFDVKPTFVNAMQNDFDAHIEGLDFASPNALETINGWASDNTNGKIPQVLNEISSDAVMFLMNALYFKGSWTQKFDPEGTIEEAFNYDDGSSANVPFMHGEIPSRIYESDGFKVLELTYGRKNYSMVLIVPNDDLNTFNEQFDGETWADITNTLSDQPEMKVDVSMPRFTFEYEKKLNDQLQSLGMVDAFNPVMANLSGISDISLYVSFVKQNTFIDVNEDGTEAAAVTTVGIELTSIEDPPPTFRIDKPFIFAIRERTTNTLMFIGQVFSP